MKTVKELMRLPYKMEIVPDQYEGGYVISFPELPGCLSSGKTIEQAIKNGEDAKKQWFIAALEDNITINEPLELESYSGQFKLRIPKSLHKEIVTQAKREGISMNQYCVYLLSKNI